jgi:hypothetical protein
MLANNEIFREIKYRRNVQNRAKVKTSFSFLFRSFKNLILNTYSTGKQNKWRSLPCAITLHVVCETPCLFLAEQIHFPWSLKREKTVQCEARGQNFTFS